MSKPKKIKISRRQKIKQGIRKKIRGTAKVPRLCVYRSNTSIYAFLVDDDKGVTLVSETSLNSKEKSKGSKVEQSLTVGKLLAEKCKEKKIKKVVFDRNGFLYHGRVKAVAEGAREGGLIF